MRAAALVADPAGNADCEPELEITRELLQRAGETMRDPAPGAGVLAQDRGEVGVAVTLVKKHRFAEPGGEIELAVEALLLRSAWREITEIIEAAFTDGHHGGVARQGLELGGCLDSELRGMVRMHAGGREQFAGMRVGESEGARAALE